MRRKGCPLCALATATALAVVATPQAHARTIHPAVVPPRREAHVKGLAARPCPKKGRRRVKAGGRLVRCPAKPGSPLPRKVAARRAERLFEALQQNFYLPALGLFREALGATRPSFLWSFSQGFGATVAVAALPGEGSRLQPVLQSELGGLDLYLTNNVPSAVSARLQGLQSLPHFNATVSSLKEGETAFYDDNDWVGLELLRLYQETHEETPLALAEQILAFEMASWDEEPGLPCPGGIPHSTRPQAPNRSTISTAPAAELAVLLYGITHNERDLQFARTAYAWVRNCLRSPEGLYFDHLEADGEVDPELWSYTQGVMIGAGALLYTVTKESAYLEEALASAGAAYAHFPLEELAAENPFFVEIYLRNQLYLDSLLKGKRARTVTEEYLNWAWENLRVGKGLILSADGSPTVLLGQAAYVQLYALLALPPALDL